YSTKNMAPSFSPPENPGSGFAASGVTFASWAGAGWTWHSNNRAVEIIRQYRGSNMVVVPHLTASRECERSHWHRSVSTHSMQAPRRIRCLRTLSGVGAIAAPRVLPLFGLVPSAAARLPTGPRVWACGSGSAGWTIQPRIEYEQKGTINLCAVRSLTPKGP